jgi:ABC-type multidrug transport system ATPase subunit
VFLSSHLLDEVEKICDHAAIVDRGKVIAQGPIAELARGGDGARNELIVGVDDVELALGTLEGSELVHEARRSDEGLRVWLSGEPASAAQVNASLVRAGVGVARLEPVRHSLEERFLEVTSRLEGPASGSVLPGGAVGAGADDAARDRSASVPEVKA